MIVTNHIWTENPIYCHLLRKVLIADVDHLRNNCQTCPFFRGSAQGEGVENAYYDGSGEAQIQNPDPDALMRTMQGIPDTLIQQAADEHLASIRVKEVLKWMPSLKQISVETYAITLDGVNAGYLEFGPVVSIDVRSTHPKLVHEVGQMITNPVDYGGRKLTVGMPDYPKAVLNKLAALGFTYKVKES